MLSLILARAANGVIGANNALPWHLPEDMAHFKALTLGKPVVMGRKTWDSLPPRFRPLPGRQNIVVTRNAAWRAEGATAVHSLSDALKAAGDAPEVMLIGGAQLYAEGLPIAQRVYLTEIEREYEGDAFFPLLPAFQWRGTAREDHVSEKDTSLAFSFVTYERVSPSPQSQRG
ncbi:dihydrofolate reductase [beta proteobacterium AAP99]|nr:dihydrofolate reductase [beta proteobacterium AAP99]